jgi:hypothetical protein
MSEYPQAQWVWGYLHFALRASGVAKPSINLPMLKLINNYVSALFNASKIPTGVYMKRLSGLISSTKINPLNSRTRSVAFINKSAGVN